MKKLLCAAVSAISLAPAAYAGDVGLSISIGQPGFYGQINIGDFPQPRVIYAQPVVVAPAPEYREAMPIYLRVPPGYERHWERHCREYNACGRRVYFVRDDWYRNEYVPHYRHGGDEGGRDRPHDNGRGKGHDDRGHDRGHDEHRDQERGDRG